VCFILIIVEVFFLYLKTVGSCKECVWKMNYRKQIQNVQRREVFEIY